MKKNIKLAIICFCLVLVVAVTIVILTNIKGDKGEQTLVNSNTTLQKSSDGTVYESKEEIKEGNSKDNNTGKIEESKVYESNEKEFKVESTD